MPPLPSSLSQLLEEWADSNYGNMSSQFQTGMGDYPLASPHSVTTKKAPIIS